MPRARLFVMAAALTALLAGAAQAKTLRIGLAEDPDLLDPAVARTFVGRIVFASLCDKLFDITPDLKIVPQLAASYQWAPDNKSVTIKLRQGVLFQDGTPLNAEAVKFNIERDLNLKGSNRKSEISAVKGVEVIDDQTVKLDLSSPFSPLLAALTDRAGMMVSPKAAKAEGENFAAHPVCAGPYKFVERVAQDHITVEKFDKYWNKGHIFIDRIEYRTIVDAAVRVANLQAGSLDFMERLQPSDVAAVRNNPNLEVASIPEIGYIGITANIGNGARAASIFGKDPRVRQALSLAIDRKALVQAVYNGEYLPGDQPFSPVSPWFDKNFPVPGPDIAKAKQLLKEAGHSNPTIELMVPTTSDDQQVAQVIQAMAQQAGITIKIKAVEFATSLDREQQGDFEAYQIGWSGRVDPDGNLYTFLACKGNLNYGRYCNPEVDKLLDQARETSDTAARKKLYDEVDAIAQRDLPIIYLYNRKWIYGYTKKLTGFKPYPDGLVRVVDLKLQ
ncbi:MAG TPA: ABC transporter substrate-binding protein [Alphaproteobacteria bacterium]|nr:ABC transporter substrate-binding protein [Alphaproteobacteria bacterium]